MEVHDVLDLDARGTPELLRERVEADWLHGPGEPPLEIEATGGGSLVVRGTRSQQARVHAALEALRRATAPR